VNRLPVAGDAVLASLLRTGVFLLSLVSVAPCAASEARSGGPFVPTPQAVVDEMLSLARVASDDFVLDLGSGDGRIVLTAASRFQTRGRGVDIDAELVDLSNKEARRRGVEKLVRFQRDDALKTRLDDATVLTLYLLPELMHRLRDRVYSELKPGTRVVSHDFRFIEWEPDRTVTIDVAEKYGTSGKWQSTLYLWIVPAKVEGRWQFAATEDGEENDFLSFSQKFQRVEGHATRGSQRIPLQDVRLEGNTIRFLLPGVDESQASEFSGTVSGNRISGVIKSRDGSVPWRMTRIGAPVSSLQSR
jgi:ubiquinone/menaquinone biosynthesis C-methylase UbiE